MKHPIPSEALDDRLAFVGNSGSGKSYNAMGNVERGIRQGHRTGIIDPTGVWHGLRLLEDGKTPSGLDVVIFGGKHGDLPLTEHSGALIGETVVGMRESFILDLKLLGSKAAERRFMNAFTTALYRRKVDNDADLLTFVVDEADMFAPQQLTDKEGGAAQLLGMMETIVRRGRIDGFIPWLISQRPAVLNKNVLSQVDGLAIFKLTSSQDRDAIGNWVKGQADMAQWRALYGQLSELETGTGLVWIPSRKIFDVAAFPKKKTFDSTRSPKRGEKRAAVELQPLDLGKLKDRLAKVDAEVKANDPAELRKQIVDLNRRVAAAEKAKPATTTVVQAGPSQEQIDALILQAEDAGKTLGRHEGRVEYAKELLMKIKELEALGIRDLAKAIDRLAAAIEAETTANAPKVRAVSRPAVTTAARPAVSSSAIAPVPAAAAAKLAEGLSRPQQRILDALAWLESVRIPAADRTRVAWLADASPKSSSFMNNLGVLSTGGLIRYPRQGEVALTDSGRAVANHPGNPLSTADLHAAIQAKLPAPQWRIVEQLVSEHPKALTREVLAERAGASPASSSYMNNLGTLRGLGLIDYPERGTVVATPILFVEG